MSATRPMAEVLATVRRDATDDALRFLAETIRAGRSFRERVVPGVCASLAETLPDHRIPFAFPTVACHSKG